MAGRFRPDGPDLPIEFSRVSVDGRVTLVIDSSADAIRTWWVPLDVGSLDEAVMGLGIREKIAPAMRSAQVGRLCRHDPEPPAPSAIVHTIADWLRKRPLDAVVWTALPPRGPDGGPGRPDFACLLGHLESLRGAARTRAEEYIRRAPGTVRTPHRRGFERALGWTPDRGKDSLWVAPSGRVSDRVSFREAAANRGEGGST